MTNPTEQDHGQASALDTLFPNGVVALNSINVRSHIEQYLTAEREATMRGAEASSAFMLRSVAPLSHELLAGGVARIGWDGAMQRRPHPILRAYLGYVDTSEIAAAVQAAAADPRVRSIMLVVDSPGGAITGVAELADVIAAVASSKPVVALTDGQLASAAYWAVSGASAIYGTGPTVTAGSIGVLMVHSYTPRTDGTVVTEITAGKFKRMGSAARALTNEDRSHLQDRVDYLTQLFVNAVATNRRLSASAVAAQEGRTYVGQQAIDAGLFDGLMSQGKLESQLAADPSRFMRRRPGAVASTPAAVKPSSSANATTWPPKLQPVVSAPVTPATMLVATSQAEEDMRAEAAEMVRLHRITTGRFPTVMKWAAWEQRGAARAKVDGCTLVEGIKREGYLHPYVSQTDHGKRGTPGVKPAIVLTKQQMAERAASWAAFKGVGVVEAFTWLGWK
jgi:signal peptide peptidase SppA